MNDKMIQGLMNAPSHKRYKSFISRVCDQSEVWVLNAEDGYATYEDKGEIYLMVWPDKEFARLSIEEKSEIPESIEIHEFLKRAYAAAQDNEMAGYMVFPNGRDASLVGGGKLIDDIEEELERLE